VKRLCVFCGSNPGFNPAYREAATALGSLLAERHIELVFGGGHIGLMGAVADAVLRAGGHVIGVIPHALVARELAHTGIQDLRAVNSMHERKALMAELSDGFIALPGGYGTFEEFFEIITWGQLGIHHKPCGLLNIQGYYTPLLQLVEMGVKEGFIPESHRELVLVESTPTGLLEKMQGYHSSATAKWMGLSQT